MIRQSMTRVTILAIALTPLLSACAGIEQTFRDANGVVNEVIDLSAEADSPTQKEPLYAIEDRVESACRPLFESANQRMTGADVSMLAKVSVLMSSGRCRSSVDQARRDLDQYREEMDDASKVAEAEKPKAF